MNRIPALKPKMSALVSGDYGTGKTTIIKAWSRSLGKGAFWGAPQQKGAPPEYSDMAVVVHSAREMEKAAAKAAFVVWPSPPSSVGMEAMREAFNDFCRIAMTFQDAVIGCDEIQRLLGDSKRLVDAPPAFQDLVELGHKEPNRLAKLYGAHRLAQIPLALGAGAARISTRPFPGDEGGLEPFFGRDGTARMRQFRVGDFAYWSRETGALLPLRLDLSSRGNAGVEGRGALLGGSKP